MNTKPVSKHGNSHPSTNTSVHALIRASIQIYPSTCTIAKHPSTRNSCVHPYINSSIHINVHPCTHLSINLRIHPLRHPSILLGDLRGIGQIGAKPGGAETCSDSSQERIANRRFEARRRSPIESHCMHTHIYTHTLTHSIHNRSPSLFTLCELPVGKNLGPASAPSLILSLCVEYSFLQCPPHSLPPPIETWIRAEMPSRVEAGSDALLPTQVPN